MKPNSLKYKFWDLVFSFWAKYIRVIRIVCIVSLLLLVGAGWQMFVAAPLLVIYGMSGYIEGKKD